MHTQYKLMSVFLLLAANAVVADEAADLDTARAEVDAAVTAMLTAYAANDPEAYFSHFGEEFTLLNSRGGVQSAAEYRERWSATIAKGGGVVSMDPNFPRSIRLSDDGNTAVVIVSAMPASYRFPDDAGNFSEASYKWFDTLVWMKRGGEWKLVHYHFNDAT